MRAPDGLSGRGWCRTRVNRSGTLYTATYGAVSSLARNPFEKRPLYHFYPGSRALTVGSWGCTWRSRSWSSPG